MIKNETPKRPTHRVYAVKKTGKDKSHWTEIGAAWAHQDFKGFSRKLDFSGGREGRGPSVETAPWTNRPTKAGLAFSLIRVSSPSETPVESRADPLILPKTEPGGSAMGPHNPVQF